MENRNSNILEAILARVAFDLTKNKIHHSFKDYITLELLREDSTMAYRILAMKLESWEMYQVLSRIENIIKSQPNIEPLSIEEFLRIYKHNIQRKHPQIPRPSQLHRLQRNRQPNPIPPIQKIPQPKHTSMQG